MLSDDELNEVLERWDAPGAPTGMRPPRQRPAWVSWLRWLGSGTIRVPVPVGILTVMVVVLSVYWAMSARRPAIAATAQQRVSFTDFQPVKQVQPRIIRSEYDDR